MDKIKIFIKKNKFYISGIIILCWVVFVNRFPNGYVLVGGDIFQFIDPKENFAKLFYDWQGRFSIFYSFFYLISLLGVSDSSALSFYLGLFIFGSYLSFGIFSKLIFPKLSDLFRTFFSLFYALNLYTLYVFTYSWGYSYYQSLYIFIPLLFGLYIRFIQNKEKKWAILFLLALFFASTGFGNPAFAISFSVVVFMLTILMVLFRVISLDRKLVFSLITLAVASIVINAYWILPLLPQMKGGVDNLFSGNIIDLDWWLRHTSNPVFDTLRLMQYNNWYFPDNFPYKELYKFQFLFQWASLLPMGLIVLGLFSKSNKKNKKLYFASLSMLLILTVLVAKVRFPFEKINEFFYHIWGFNTLRGYEKLAIFMPFFFAVLMLITAEKFRYRRTLRFFLMMILLTPLPFYAGKLQQNLSAVFVRDTVGLESKDYKKSKYSFLVKIPEEYYSIKKIINNDPGNFKISFLPYSVLDSVGWANYPMWKMAGNDITKYLYNKEALDPNVACFSGWMCAKDFSDSEDPDWMIKYLGSMGVKYIIYHKDVETGFYEQSLDEISKLESLGLISLITENNYFNLYQIDSSYSFSQVGWISRDVDFEPNKNSIDTGYQIAKSEYVQADFLKVNPSKYVVETGGRSGELVFLEPYSDNWQAYAIDSAGGKIRIDKHSDTLAGVNEWQINSNRNFGKIIIEFWPMKLFYWGMGISLLTVVSLIGSLLINHIHEINKFRGN